ncbi:MAG: serine/threonine-protein phosphatase [Planctomycetota bacterium]|nr:MAG: serine/threonine-protein phosphatase [Planctomycetota bacterium]
MADGMEKEQVVKSKGFSLSWGVASDKGRVRDENEDTFLVEPELGLFLVSDGMGGHRGGALASKIVAQDLPVMIETRLHKLRGHSRRAARLLFKRMITEQSRQLRMEGFSESGYKEMGATLVMTLIKDGRAYIGSVGDSRIYRFRHGRLVQMTKEHSVVSELLSAGKIEPQDVQDHPAQGQLTHYIGMEESIEPYVRSFAVKDSDRLLLCTDGLTDMVDNKSLARILGDTNDAQTVCDVLVKSANEAGGLDNITVIVIDCRGS